ncbi:hypothetical protein [Polymorphospora sp. NPDC050346]|uniref:hypothetical protein n=1 Tax=Polymorphospora sp. NPDC050346 TaxID=3155780 RepID=UPI0033C483E0
MKSVIRTGFVAMTVAVLALVAAAPASAATGSWTESRSKYNIYFDGGYATMYFSKPQSQVPNNTSITGTTVYVTPYTNGRTTETITICYRQQYGTSDWACTAPQDITTATTIPVSLFNGQSARGAVHVRHTLYGGTYPTTGGSAQDTVTVNYSY